MATDTESQTEPESDSIKDSKKISPLFRLTITIIKLCWIMAAIYIMVVEDNIMYIPIVFMIIKSVILPLGFLIEQIVINKKSNGWLRTNYFYFTLMFYSLLWVMVMIIIIVHISNMQNNTEFVFYLVYLDIEYFGTTIILLILMFRCIAKAKQ